MAIRRPDVCAACRRDLPAGTKAYWDKNRRAVTCVDCVDRPAPIEPSVAGASAQREHDRRRNAREGRLKDRYGKLGTLAAWWSDGPQHERAWAKGARGERENAKWLERLVGDEPIRLIHDRRVPGSKANIDHIAVAASGVMVIDSKKLAGKVRVVSRGGILSQRETHLLVGGRKRTNLVEGVERQIAVVRGVLDELGQLGVPVTGALCMANTEDLPLLSRLELRGVVVAGPRRVAKLLKEPGPISPHDIAGIADALERRLPPAA
jgi:hypothetical protein